MKNRLPRFTHDTQTIALFIGKGGIIAFLFFVSFKAVTTAFIKLGSLWGIGTIFFAITFCLWLFLRYMLPAKTVSEVIDGIFCIATLYGVVLGVSVVGIIVSQSIAELFNASLGWLSFGGFLLFILLLCARVSYHYSESN